jgi:mannose-6-phosphate isomerase-like protein (cupin superfamily)
VAPLTDAVYFEDVRKAAKRNSWFRQVVCTNRHSQIVLMAIPPGGEIGDEIHEGTDQVLVIVEGEGDARVAARVRAIGPNDLVAVRAGTRHNIRNTGHGDLKLFAVVAPPALAEGTIHRTREDAIGAMVTSERARSA